MPSTTPGLTPPAGAQHLAGLQLVSALPPLPSREADAASWVPPPSADRCWHRWGGLGFTSLPGHMNEPGLIFIVYVLMPLEHESLRPFN